jgi:hypothetical protein
MIINPTIVTSENVAHVVPSHFDISQNDGGVAGCEVTSDAGAEAIYRGGTSGRSLDAGAVVVAAAVAGIAEAVAAGAVAVAGASSMIAPPQIS